jgi:RHS repeat-associated protein
MTLQVTAPKLVLARTPTMPGIVYKTGPNETYSYSSRGALRQSTKNGVATTFTVDAAGRTAQSVVAGQAPVNYQYDGLDRVLNRNGAAFTYTGTAMDPTSDGTTTFSRGPDGTPLWLTKAGATVAAGMDRHGDLAFTMNANLTIGSTSVYDPFGVPTVKTGPGTAIGFQADWTEPSTGNVWMGARWYTPGNASFTTRDTYAGNPATPVSLNRYTYGSNNPIRYSDPTGHWACGDDYCDDSQIATGDGTPWGGSSSSGAQTLTNSELWAQYQSTGYIPDDNPINTTTTIHETSDGSVVIWNPSSQVGGYLGADGSSMQITPEGRSGNEAPATSKLQEKVFVIDPSFGSAAAGEGDYMLTSSKVKPKTSTTTTTTTTLPKGGDPRIVKILEDIKNSTGVDYTSYSTKVLISDCPNPINKNDNPRKLGISCHQGLANPSDVSMPIYDKDGKKIGELPPHSFAVRTDQVTPGVVVHEVIHLTGTIESDQTPVTVTGTNAKGQSKTITPSDPAGVRPDGIPASELATDCATAELGVSKGLNYKRKVDEAADKLKAGGYKVSTPACP